MNYIPLSYGLAFLLSSSSNNNNNNNNDVFVLTSLTTAIAKSFSTDSTDPLEFSI
jgi:hypothetical protein